MTLEKGVRMSETRHTLIDTELGELTLVADHEGLTAVYFPEHRRRPDAATFGDRARSSEDPVLAGVEEELREYLAGSREMFDTPLAPQGDEFSQRVWALLREIRYGETTTYGALAEQLGNRALAQRVGQSVGRNPLSILIPCHRVVGADGSLTGYAGGLERKRRLLQLEEPPAESTSRLF